MELLGGKSSSTAQKCPKIVMFAFLTLVAITLVPVFRSLNNYPNAATLDASSEVSPPYDERAEEEEDIKIKVEGDGCDIFTGEWVPNPNAPYYTNATCWAIHQHQNCMKFGRPDDGFMKWRWKPDGCDLPLFNPFQFLDIVRNKSLAFVGDSVGRNHVQSLICLLSRVAYPLDVSETKDENRKHFMYKDYDFNITMFWSPYLVKTGVTFSEFNANPFDLYLDEYDESWTTKIKDFDYVIINAGHWFFRPTSFYLQGNLVGCLYCKDPNITQLTSDFSYQRALRTAFRAINSLENFKGVAFFRSFAPEHFERGRWDQGGECKRTVPLRRNDSSALSEFKLDLYDIQREEFRIAEEEGRRKGTRLRLFDVTQAMLLRPDGHPNKYGHRLNLNLTYYNDCVHWCLPGPIDTWADFFLEMLKRGFQNRSPS